MADRGFMFNVTVSKNRLKEIAKLLQKKYREKTGLFIAEGEKILEEMLSSDVDIVEVYTLKDLCIDFPYYKINVEEMKKIASTNTPCEVLTVAKKKFYNVKNFKKLNNIVLLNAISDPGNLGTIIRSAAAFGIQGIILFGNCVDLYSQKVIRSTAGNFFKIPIIQLNSIEELTKYFSNHIKISTSLSSENNISLEECKNIKNKIVMFGAEAKGLEENLIKISNKNIKLKMENGVDSINLAICASIIMYELKKVTGQQHLSIREFRCEEKI